MFINFNPRSPWGERLSFLMSFCKQALFQSTLSVRRATSAGLSLYFGSSISIHVLREESDSSWVWQTWRKTQFQSTLSVRRATHSFLKLFCVLSISIHALREESDARTDDNRKSLTISIHALREESDCSLSRYFFNSFDFNPRSPWGERQMMKFIRSDKDLFQSTLSVRRATKHFLHFAQQLGDFNPRSPWGERPPPSKRITPLIFISIHALREESDPKRQNCNWP